MAGKEPVNPWLALADLLSEGGSLRPNSLDGGYKIACYQPNLLPITERVKTDKVKEYWVQQYVLHNFKHLGFSSITGPNDTGPDFTTKIKGKRVAIEVEVLCENYVAHGHPDDSSFDKVGILIVLESNNPPPALKRQLPKRIIHVDKDHFTEWYIAAAREYAKQKEKEAEPERNRVRLHVLTGEFKSRWVAVCGHKERDMALCPDCDSCPYYGEPHTATADFENLALTFLANRNPSKFVLGDIAASDIDEWFIKVMADDMGLPPRLRPSFEQQLRSALKSGNPY